MTALILVALAITDAAAQRRISMSPPPDAMLIEVVGHQWWWDFVYHGAPQDLVSSPNELHIPVGVPIAIKASSRDVIHSFWVPNLTGKRDLIPGMTTHMWLQADQPGTEVSHRVRPRSVLRPGPWRPTTARPPRRSRRLRLHPPHFAPDPSRRMAPPPHHRPPLHPPPPPVAIDRPGRRASEALPHVHGCLRRWTVAQADPSCTLVRRQARWPRGRGRDGAHTTAQPRTVIANALRDRL